MENIAVENGESCLVYHDTEKAFNVLLSITKDKNKYEEIAKNGQKAVLTYHSRKRVSEELFNLFR